MGSFSCNSGLRTSPGYPHDQHANHDRYRAGYGQPGACAAGKELDGWWFVSVHLLLEVIVDILLYSMLLCMKSLTVLFGFGKQRIRKASLYFSMWKFSIWKKRSEPQWEAEKQKKTVVLFHHASPPTPGLFRIESFPKEIWSFHDDVWHLKPPTSPSSRANAFTAPCRLFSIRQPFL